MVRAENRVGNICGWATNGSGLCRRRELDWFFATEARVNRDNLIGETGIGGMRVATEADRDRIVCKGETVAFAGTEEGRKGGSDRCESSARETLGNIYMFAGYSRCRKKSVVAYVRIRGSFFRIRPFACTVVFGICGCSWSRTSIGQQKGEDVEQLRFYTRTVVVRSRCHIGQP